MKTVTFFQDGAAPFSREYIDSAGDALIDDVTGLAPGKDEQ